MIWGYHYFRKHPGGGNSLRILVPPMEGWKNLYDAGLGVIKIASFKGPMDP